MIDMPGKSYGGALPPLSQWQAGIRDQLRGDVALLASEIGERNLQRYGKLVQAADYIEQQLRQAGYATNRHRFQVAGLDCCNIEAEIAGSAGSDEVVVIGAHYDSIVGSPGANDNASGTAALLALARSLAGFRPRRTLRFVAFANEEPPYFQTDAMGSLLYARRCRERKEQVTAMLSLETIGYYRDEPGSQHYPPLFAAFYPPQGDFIGVVGNLGSRQLVRRVVASFRRHAKFPCEGAAAPSAITGVSWSDHWSFWKQGYAAAMITDTAPFRYPYYHTPDDTIDQLDFDRMARVVDGLRAVVKDLTDG
jgi:Zn-dependent M28 family amino/carboxypeptidase